MSSAAHGKVTDSRKPLKTTKEGEVMQITIYNYSKQCLETIDLEISEENTTWFDDDSYDHNIHMITDFKSGLLISPRGYEYPLLIAETSRAAIDYNSQKALALKASYIDAVTE